MVHSPNAARLYAELLAVPPEQQSLGGDHTHAPFLRVDVLE